MRNLSFEIPDVCYCAVYIQQEKEYYDKVRKDCVDMLQFLMENSTGIKRKDMTPGDLRVLIKFSRWFLRVRKYGWPGQRRTAIRHFLYMNFNTDKVVVFNVADPDGGITSTGPIHPLIRGIHYPTVK